MNLLCVVMVFILGFHSAGSAYKCSKFMAAWRELESIMLNEISQVVKEKYHMISPIRGNLIKKTNEQVK